LTKDELVRFAAAVESLSQHPLAAAIVREAQRLRLEPLSAVDFDSSSGLGAGATVAGRAVVVGSTVMLQQAGIAAGELAEAIEQAGRAASTVVLVSVDGRLAGSIALGDPVRETTAPAVRRLRDAGLRVIMLTGDRRAVGEAAAREAGISEVIAEVLPEQKVATIATLQREGRVVAMVGDGINDAPALAQADVGIAMGGGAGVAIEAADAALMREDLGAVADLILLSRRTLRIIHQNLFWALAYNVIAIPVAAGVLYPATGMLLSPVIASAAMAFSSVSVVGNSLRLRNAGLSTARARRPLPGRTGPAPHAAEAR
jgi:Cu+-exporting ATPase